MTSATDVSTWTARPYWQQALALAVSLAACFATAWVGSRFMPGPWYQQLAKPGWTPPSWVFGPVWSVLYLAMAVAAWLVWRNSGKAAGPALAVFAVQLVFNAAWSWLFFGLHRPGLALLDLLALAGTILLSAMMFLRFSQTAAILMLVYLAWVCFAGALNAAVWRLNA